MGGWLRTFLRSVKLTQEILQVHFEIRVFPGRFRGAAGVGTLNGIHRQLPGHPEAMPCPDHGRTDLRVAFLGEVDEALDNPIPVKGMQDSRSHASG